jgi:hypothetical protein
VEAISKLATHPVFQALSFAEYQTSSPSTLFLFDVDFEMLRANHLHDELEKTHGKSMPLKKKRHPIAVLDFIFSPLSTKTTLGFLHPRHMLPPPPRENQDH